MSCRVNEPISHVRSSSQIQPPPPPPHAPSLSRLSTASTHTRAVCVSMWCHISFGEQSVAAEGVQALAHLSWCRSPALGAAGEPVLVELGADVDGGLSAEGVPGLVDLHQADHCQRHSISPRRNPMPLAAETPQTAAGLEPSSPKSPGKGLGHRPAAAGGQRQAPDRVGRSPACCSRELSPGSPASIPATTQDGGPCCGTTARYGALGCLCCSTGPREPPAQPVPSPTHHPSCPAAGGRRSW